MSDLSTSGPTSGQGSPIVFPHLQESKPPRFLIVRLSAYGDIIQSWTLVGWIRRHWPEAHIGWLIEPEAVALLRDLPGLDAIHVLPHKEWMRTLVHQPLQLGGIWPQVDQLRSELLAARYDIAIDPQGLWKGSLWPWWVNIPRRIGFKPSRETVAWAYSETVPGVDRRSSSLHASQEFAQLLTGLELPVPNREDLLDCWPTPRVSAETKIQVGQWLGPVTPERPRIVLAPPTTWASKHWPQAHWAALLTELAHYQVQVVLVGGLGDVGYCDAILEQLGIAWPTDWHNLTGKTDWSELQAVLQTAEIFIGPDSGPLHLASAVAANQPARDNGLPCPTIIGLYGATAIARTGPLGNRHLTLNHPLPCVPCHERTCRYGHMDCLAKTSPQQVLASLKAILPLESLIP